MSGTLSGRVEDEKLEELDLLLEENNHSRSDLVESAVENYIKSPTFRFVTDKTIEEKDYTLEDLTGDLDEDDYEKLYRSIRDIVSGMQFSDKERVYQAGEELHEVDAEFGENVARYISRIPESYWEN